MKIDFLGVHLVSYYNVSQLEFLDGQKVEKLLPLVKTNMAASMYHQLELKQTRFNIDLTLFFFNIAQEIHDGFGGRIVRWGAVINEIVKD